MIDSDARPYGRRTFLGLMAAGLTSFFWARPLWKALSPATQILPASVRDALPAGGWRIYTIASAMPIFNPATWRIRIDGLVEQPMELTYADGTTERVRLPVEMWNLGPRFAYRVRGGKRVTAVVVDPRGALPDTDRANNRLR